MMALYKYRWLIFFSILISLVALAYYYDIQANLKQINEVRNNENVLTNQLQDLMQLKQDTQQNKIYTQIVTQPQIAADLAALVSLNGLNLQSIKFMHSIPYLTINLMMQGDFKQFTKWIMALNQQPYPFVISHFTCQTGELTKLIFTVDILVLELVKFMHLSATNSELVSFYNPFCNEVSEQIAETTSIDLTKVKIEKIKMIGYLQQGIKKEALLLLPNNVIISIVEGDSLLRGLVKKIMPQQTVVEFPQHKQFIIQ